jgi:hypothetical protein
VNHYLAPFAHGPERIRAQTIREEEAEAEHKDGEEEEARHAMVIGQGARNLDPEGCLDTPPEAGEGGYHA